MQLKIEILSYWHTGAGKSGGATIDALVEKDDGIPYLPGRNLKGLVRDAVYCAEEWGRVPKNLTNTLFGTRAEEQGKRRHDTDSGALRFCNATLEPALASWLKNPASYDAAALQKHLFTTLYATQIEHDSGAAFDKSLRSIEASIPLTLYAQLDNIKPEQLTAYPDWQSDLKKCLVLMRAVGSWRNRGLGRAVVTLVENNHAAS